MRKRLSRLLAAAVVLCALPLLLAACAGRQAEDGLDEGTLRIGVAKDIRGFDVQNYSLSALEAVHVNVFNHLVRWDGDMRVQPDLAASWERRDARTWRFRLRRDVRWHNGDPLVAEDVRYTLERAARDDTVTDPNYRIIERVDVIDAHTLDVVTRQDDPMLLSRLARVGSYIMPSRYIRERGFPHFLAHPIGTGPYRVQSWTKDDRVVLGANADYFGGTPRWRTVVVRAIPDDSTRVSELLTGGVDVAVGIPAPDVARIERDEGLRIVTGPSQRIMQLLVRTSPGYATHDPGVRRALALAIDAGLLCEAIFDGRATPTSALVPPGSVGFDPALHESTAANPAAARALLARAAPGGAVEIGMVATSGVYGQDKEIALAVASMLENAGFRVDLELLDGTQFNRLVRQRRMPELYMVGYTNSMFDGQVSLQRFSATAGGGASDYANPAYDELLLRAGAEMDAGIRQALLLDAQAMVARDLPAIPLFQYPDVYGIDARLRFSPAPDELIRADAILLDERGAAPVARPHVRGAPAGPSGTTGA